MKKKAVWVVLCWAVVLLSGCANGLFYHPSRKVYQTPADKNLAFESVFFNSKDGTKLHGWFVPSTSSPLGTVLFFHGNAQNLTSHFSFMSWLPESGYNLFIFDYRGYGESEGSPGRRGMHKDSLAALRYIRSRPDVDEERLFVIGQSLGGAQAIAAVAREEGPVRVRAVVIDSSFYSYRSIVRDKIGLIPVLSLLKWPLSFVMATNAHSPGSVIDELSPTPVLIIHGTCDRIIPYHHGKELYEKAASPKEFWRIEKGRHTDAFMAHGSEYKMKLLDYFKKYSGELQVNEILTNRDRECNNN